MIIPYEIVYFIVGFASAFIISGILLLVFIRKFKKQITSSSMFDLNKIKDIIENKSKSNNDVLPFIIDEKPNCNFISKDIEVVDLDDKETDMKDFVKRARKKVGDEK